MHKINWWRVASIALLAGSALLGFGHEQHQLTRKIQSALWKKIQTEQIKEI